MLQRMLALAALTLSLIAGMATAQDTVKIGLILPMTGPFASTGRQIDGAVKLWMQQNGTMVAGKKIEVILKDDAGTPDTTRRLAQELVVNDKVQVLAGFGLTPLALATVPIATQAKVPELVMAAATSSITEQSPFVIRAGFTLPQVTTPLADWAPKNGISKVVTLVSDYGPGIDAETAFKSRFTANGGQVLAELRVPLRSPDFAPFLQRVRDANPDAVFVFVPSGAGSVFMKQFAERGLDKSGIRSDWHRRRYRRRHPQRHGGRRARRDHLVPLFRCAPVGSQQSIRGRLQEAQWHASEFPLARRLRWHADDLRGAEGDQGRRERRGAARRDEGNVVRKPARAGDDRSRDTRSVQNVYMRKVERVGGELYNVEFATVSAVKDPMHK